MNKILITGCAVAAAFAAVAMPTKKELAQAQRLVEDVTRIDLKAVKAGTKSPKEAAEAHLALADKAASDAEKYLLLQGAFKLYARSEEYDLAAETLITMNRMIDSIPPALMLELIDEEFHRGMGEKAPKVLQIYKAAKRTVKCRKDLAEVEKSLKAKPNDPVLNRTLGECCAELGNWPRARDAFKKSGGASAEATAKESQSGATLAEAADYWWDYQKANGMTVYRQHASGLYVRALKDAAFTGLLRTRAEQRVKDANAWDEVLKFDEQKPMGLYCVIDLSGGPKAEYYPVSYLDAAPNCGWTDEYKTTKLVLRQIKPGSFEYLPGKKFTLTKSFYIGVFEVTQKQYELVMGSNPAKFCGETRPVEVVSYGMIRGCRKGLMWPQTEVVDDDSFIGKIRCRTGLRFDLPTEVQWEYACRAGTKSKYYGGDDDGAMKFLGMCKETGGEHAHHTVVGSFKPNMWGLYDMHGNVWEWCLDRGEDGWGMFDWTREQKEMLTDPRGCTDGTWRFVRGGCCHWKAALCGSSIRHKVKQGDVHGDGGFRLAIQPTFKPSKGMGVAPKSFDLKDGVKIEMIGCPASEGVIELGIVDAAVLSGPYKFRITRPFWMMKANLSLQQLLACGIETYLKDARWAPSLKAHPEIWDRYCGDIGLNQIEIVCKVLNSKYKDIVPKGYVFRLPTLAEWMYARQSGSRDMKDPYTNWQVLSEEERKQYFPAVFTTMIEYSKTHGGALPGGMPSDRKHKNKWGFMDMWTFHTPLLDRVSETDGAEVVSKKERTSIDVVSINYLQGNDPFSFVNGENFRRLNVSGSISGHDFLQISEAGEKSWGYRSARIVLGPDLVSEWKTKHKCEVKTMEDKYLEIDLSGGVNAKTFPARIVRGAINANTDEYKTNKLLLKYVQPGKFMSGDSVRAKDKCKAVSVQTGFLLGVFEVTQRQWELVMGTRPSFFTNATCYATRPVESVTRGEIEKDGNSFISRLNAKLPKDCGVVVSLPYASQWEYACRAGTTTDWYNGKNCLSDADERLFFEIGRCHHNGGWNDALWGGFKGCWEGAYKGRNPWCSQYPVVMRSADGMFGTAKVGSYKPNGWGFYDMLGNVSEHCAQTGCRGGNVRTSAKECIPTDENGSGLTHYNVGFRVSGQIPSERFQ